MPVYTLADEVPTSLSQKKHHRRGNSKSSTGSDSLAYSASSSVQSTSTTGESTDSSFADIYNLIDNESVNRILGAGGNDKADLPQTISG